MGETLYLRTPEAAKRLGVAPSTLAKMRIRDGGGPPFHRWSARRIVYSLAGLDEWARQREFGSTREYRYRAVA
jgi:hypothetical protein